MPQQPQTLPVRLTNGINTKDDELVMQEMLTLENAVFDRPGSLRKRNGMTKLPGPTGAGAGGGERDLFVYRDELLLARTDGLFSRRLNPGANWTLSKGMPAYWRTTDRDVSANAYAIPTGNIDETAALCDYVECNGIGAIAWLVGTNASNSFVRCTIFDLDTGTELLSQGTVTLGTRTLGPRFSVSGNIIELWVASLTSAQVYRVPIDTTNPPTGAPSSALTGALVGAYTDNPVGPMSTDQLAGVPVYAQAQGNPNYLSLRGSLAGFSQGMGTLIATATNTIRQVAVAIDGAGNTWFAWSESNGTTTQIIRLIAVSTANLASVTGTAVTVATLASGSLPISLEVVPDPTGNTATVFWEAGTGGGETGAVYYRRVVKATGALNLPGSTRQLLGPYMHIIARGRVLNGLPHIWVTRDSLAAATAIPFYSTAYLVAVDTSDLSANPQTYVVAKALQRRAASKLGDTTTYGRIPSALTFDSTRNRYRFAMPHLVNASVETGSPIYSPNIVTLTPETTVCAALLGESLVFGAAMPQSYDGARLVESGFLHGPDKLTLGQASVGGSLSNGTYSVVAVWEWTDANGELQQSLPSGPATITLSGGTATQVINVTVPSLSLTARPPSVNVFCPLVRVFCTQAGLQEYFASASNFAVTTAVAYTISLTIASIGTAVLYTDGGVSPADQPPPTNFLSRASNRLWAHSGEGLLAYSRKRVLTRSPEFSEFRTQQLTSFNNPMALVEMAGNRVAVFAPDSVAMFAGDFADGDAIGDDEALPYRVGCSEPKSVIRYDDGALFKSLKGWYVLTDSGQLVYVGSKVEAYNAFPVKGVAVDPLSARVKIALGGVGAPTLVFDTYTRKWVVEKNAGSPNIVSIAFWRNRQQLMDASGFLWEQVPGLFTDNALAVVTRGRTGWIAPAGLQGLWSVKRIELVGLKKSDHKLVVALRYDGIETVRETFTADAGPAVALGAFRWSFMPKIQQCASLSIEFYDDFTGYTPGESYTLSEITLEMSVEAGLARLPASQKIKGV